MEVARKRAEAETQAAEVAEELRKEREILECKRQREKKMMEWVCKYFQYIETKFYNYICN